MISATHGQCWRESNVGDTDLESVINDLQRRPCRGLQRR
jgi:hypothetical protein